MSRPITQNVNELDFGVRVIGVNPPIMYKRKSTKKNKVI